MVLAWLTDTVTSDIDRAIHYTLLWGLEGVELRTVGSVEERVPHVNEEKLVRRLHEHEFPVVSIVPGMFQGPAAERTIWLNELVTFEEVLQFCQRIDCPRIVLSAFADQQVDRDAAVEALQRAGEEADGYGISLAVMNEWGMAHPTGHALAALLDEVDHALVQAAWHPAAALRAGEDPREGLNALAGRVELVRCADGLMRAGRWQERTVGDGAVGWKQQLEMLEQRSYGGPLSLEVNIEPKPEEGLRSASRLIELRRAVGPERSPSY